MQRNIYIIFLSAIIISTPRAFADNHEGTNKTLSEEGAASVMPCCEPEYSESDNDVKSKSSEVEARNKAKAMIAAAEEQVQAIYAEAEAVKQAAIEENAKLKEDISRSLAELKSKSAQFEAQLAAFRAEEDKLAKKAQQLESAKTQLDKTAKQLDAKDASLGQREADLKRSVKMLESEKASLMAKIRKQEASSVAKAAALAKRLENPEQLATNIFNTLLSKKDVDAMKDELNAALDVATAATSVSPPIKARASVVLADINERIEAIFDYEAIKSELISAYVENYNAKELLELAEFYSSALGKKLLKQSQTMNENLAISLSHKSTELMWEIDQAVAKLTSAKMIESLVRDNLHIIRKAGQLYMKDTGKRSVRFATLLQENYIRPITPINGEVYSRLVVSSTGGALRVLTNSGHIVAITYQALG